MVDSFAVQQDFLNSSCSDQIAAAASDSLAAFDSADSSNFASCHHLASHRTSFAAQHLVIAANESVNFDHPSQVEERNCFTSLVSPGLDLL